MSLYDAVAPNFDRYALFLTPAVEAIRAAMLAAISPVPRPRFLDIGAGRVLVLLAVLGRLGFPVFRRFAFLDRLVVLARTEGPGYRIDPPSKWWTPLVSSFGSGKVFDGYIASDH